MVLNNAQRVASNLKTWLRFPVIPGYNDSGVDIEEMAKFASRIPFEKASVLGYHKLGEQKYENLGRIFLLSEVSLPTNEYLQQICDIFNKFGLIATIVY